MLRHGLALGVAAVAIAVPGTAFAEVASDKVWIDVGGFWAHIDSDLRVDNTALGIEGSRIDFENDLGLDSSRALPKITAGVRLGPRFRLEGDFFRLGRNGELVIDEVLRIDDTVYPIGASVRTKFRTNIYRIGIGYSLVKTDQGEFGVSAGVHMSKGKFNIQANALGGSLLEEGRNKSFPLPNVGVYGNVHLWGPVSLQANADAFKMKAGNYKGALFDGHVALEARVLKNVGIGAGYRYAGYKLTADKSDWHGKLTYGYSGPMAYLELAF
jgi:hypothetical protein